MVAVDVWTPPGAGSAAAMWGSVLGLGLLAALNPVRLGLALLMISRPRPAQNLLAYWVGGLTVCVPELLVPLVVLHLVPMFRSGGHGSATPATSSTLSHIQIGIGVLGLSIAGMMAVRFSTRHRAHVAARGDNTSNLMLDSNTPVPIRRLLGRAQDASEEGGSAIRRLLARAHKAWENGSLWIAWLIGLGSVPVDGALFMVAIIAASGSAISAQLSAVIVFVVLMYAVVEIILVSYVTTPAKTQGLLRLLHDWVRAYHRPILVTIFAVVGVSQLAQGIGST